MIFQPSAVHDYNCVSILTGSSLPLLQGISSLPLPLQVQQSGCWNTVLDQIHTEEVGSADCRYLLLNRVIWCQQWSRCLIICLPAWTKLPLMHNQYAIHAIQIYWRGRLAHACAWMSIQTHKQTGRIIWSGLGDSWCLLILFTGDLFCSPPIQNAESTKIHSPQNNITKTGDQPVDGSGYQKLWDICCFSFDRLVVQHMGWVMRRGRMKTLCMADSCQHESCGFLTICLESQSLTDPCNMMT